MRRRRSWLPPAEILEVRQLMSARPIGDAVRANSREDCALSPSPDTLALSDGGFLTVYSDDVLDGSGSGVYVRRFNASGVPTGNAVRVNNLLMDSQIQPTIAVGTNGQLTYSWLTEVSTGAFTLEYSLDVRRFNSDGTPIAGSKRIINGSSQIPNTNSAYLYGYSEGALHAFSDAAGNAILICGTNYAEYYRVVKLSPEGTQLAAFTIDLLDGYRSSSQNIQPWVVSNGASGYVGFDVSPNGQIIAGYDLLRDHFVVDVGARRDLKAIVRRYSSTGARLNEITVAAAPLGDPNLNRYSNAFLVQPCYNGVDISVLYPNGSESLMLRKFSTSGTALTTPTRVVERITGPYAMDVLPGGKHVIAYNSFVAFGADTTLVREFDKFGVAAGTAEEIAVGANAVEELQVDAINNSRAVVTWTETLGPHSPRNIFVQRISLAANVPPKLSGFPTQVSHRAGGTMVAFANTAVVTPNAETSLAGGKLSVTITGTPHKTNHITFAETSIGGIRFSASFDSTLLSLYATDAQDNSSIIGTYAPTAGVGTTGFVVTFTSGMTNSLLQNFIRALRFYAEDRQSLADRTVKVAILTKDGQSSNTVSVNIDVM